MAMLSSKQIHVAGLPPGKLAEIRVWEMQTLVPKSQQEIEEMTKMILHKAGGISSEIIEAIKQAMTSGGSPFDKLNALKVAMEEEMNSVTNALWLKSLTSYSPARSMEKDGPGIGWISGAIQIGTGSDNNFVIAKSTSGIGETGSSIRSMTTRAMTRWFSRCSPETNLILRIHSCSQQQDTSQETTTSSIARLGSIAQSNTPAKPFSD